MGVVECQPTTSLIFKASISCDQTGYRSQTLFILQNHLQRVPIPIFRYLYFVSFENALAMIFCLLPGCFIAAWSSVQLPFSALPRFFTLIHIASCDKPVKIPLETMRPLSFTHPCTPVCLNFKADPGSEMCTLSIHYCFGAISIIVRYGQYKLIRDSCDCRVLYKH